MVLSFTLFTACKKDNSGDGGKGDGGNSNNGASIISIIYNGSALTSINLLDGQDNVEIEAKYPEDYKTNDNKNSNI